MKYFVLALLLLMSGGLFAQHDPAATFNKVEATALNTDFEAKYPGFDFHGKKIAIVSGSTGKNIISKEAYLSHKLKMNGVAVQQLVILNEAEKKASGGYDALITY